MKTYKLSTTKLRELKTWAEIKSPKLLRPILSYALEWLTPEFLGTGFRMYEISEQKVEALIPAFPTNFDYQHEIHQGLVVNAATELVKVFLQKQMPDSYFNIVSSEVSVSKKNKWNTDINLILEGEQNILDDFFIELQSKKNTQIEMQVRVQPVGSKKSDYVRVQFGVEKTELIA
jgi:hypothetical protein